VFRKPIYAGTLPSVELIMVSPALSIAVLATGWVYFCHRTDKMAYWS